MTKVELIAAVAENAGLSKKDAEQAVNATVEAIIKALAEGVWSALAPSRPVSVPLARAATPAPKRRSPSPLPPLPLSRLARP